MLIFFFFSECKSKSVLFILPGSTTKHNKLVQFPVCTHVGVFYSLEILHKLTRGTYKADFLFSNFGFG